MRLSRLSRVRKRVRKRLRVVVRIVKKFCKFFLGLQKRQKMGKFFGIEKISRIFKDGRNSKKWQIFWDWKKIPEFSRMAKTSKNGKILGMKKTTHRRPLPDSASRAPGRPPPCARPPRPRPPFYETQKIILYAFMCCLPASAHGSRRDGPGGRNAPFASKTGGSDSASQLHITRPHLAV